MSTAGSLNNSILSEEDELSNLLSQVRLSRRSLRRATSSAPPSLRGSLRDDHRRRPPPVDPFFFAAPQQQISPILPTDYGSPLSPVTPVRETLLLPRASPQSPTSSNDDSELEYVDARSHQSSGYGDSSFDNTVASIDQADLLAMGDAGPETQRHGKS